VKTPELLAPGGSFLAALHAFEAGADGVYLGLKEFSARAAAQNFSLDQLRRIRQLAADRGRRVYVAINTVVREEEMARLREVLAWLEALRVDGVIVQDLGVCDLVRSSHPGLVLHASTQMGVHSGSGLRAAKELGVRRAILSRELPLERIRALRAAYPGIEMEVFIHGALCYSFSGACLASWALTGRSGNRGECAQVCRSRFVPDGPGSAGAEGGHLFSTRDLFLGKDVLELARIGIDALKIEGRMKSPEYVFNVTRLYREVLDGGEEIPAERYAELVKRTELAFSRTRTSAWFRSPLGTRLLEKGAPGHRGAFLGSVRAVRGSSIELKVEDDLSLHDGIAFLDGDGMEITAFPVLKILHSGGAAAKFARRGEVVTIEVPREVSAVMPMKGQEIRHLSSRFLDLPQPTEASFPMCKIPVDLRIGLDHAGMFRVQPTGFPEFSAQVTLSASESRRPFLSILAALLEESGTSAFRPGTVSLTNDSGLPDDGIFVRPAELKKLKNELYRHLDRSFPPAPLVPEEAGGAEPSGPHLASPLDSQALASIADRQLLAPPGAAPVPFVGGDPGSLGIAGLADHAGFRWLPLPPILLEDSRWIEAVQVLARSHPDTRIALGLNNVSHLAFVSATEGLPNVWFFADFFFYAANDSTLRLLKRLVPRLLFAYEWLEGDRASVAPKSAAQGSRAPLLTASESRPRPVPTVRISKSFSPPLFTSLGCFTRHSTNGGRCAEDCPKDFSAGLRQGRNRFRVIVRDCVTYLFRAD
jgi:putative protease